MIPRIQTFSPSEFFIAFGKARQDRGNARSAPGKDAIELQHGTLVKYHRVQFLRLQAAVLQTALDRR